jgi:hypothetical protein
LRIPRGKSGVSNPSQHRGLAEKTGQTAETIFSEIPPRWVAVPMAAYKKRRVKTAAIAPRKLADKRLFEDGF